MVGGEGGDLLGPGFKKEGGVGCESIDKNEWLLVP